MSRFRRVLCAVACPLLLVGCASSPTAPTAPNPPSVTPNPVPGFAVYSVGMPTGGEMKVWVSQISPGKNTHLQMGQQTFYRIDYGGPADNSAYLSFQLVNEGEAPDNCHSVRGGSSVRVSPKPDTFFTDGFAVNEKTPSISALRVYVWVQPGSVLVDPNVRCADKVFDEPLNWQKP